MFLFSRKALGFRNLDTNEIIYVRKGDVTEVPDWVSHDPLYKWAKAEGSIDVVEKQVQSAVSKTDKAETIKSVEHESASQTDDISEELDAPEEVPATNKKANGSTRKSSKSAKE